MATKKKTTVDELKELIEATPKANILTNEQLQTLRETSNSLGNIRRTLEDLEGQDDISTIMFKLGILYNVANTTEDTLDELLNSYNEDYCEDCNDDEDNNW
jgi:hypothetical protein